MKSQFSQEIWTLAIALLLGLLGGLALGYPVAGLTLGAVVYIVRLLVQLQRLDQWLLSLNRDKQPELSGVLQHILDRLTKLQRQHELENNLLRSSLNRQQTLISDVQDGVLLLDNRNRIKWLNRAAEELITLDANRSLGTPIRGAIRNANFHAWLDSEEANRDLRFCFDDKSNRWLDASMTYYRENSEKLLVLRDATKLQELEEMRRDFIANLSHELRTPVTVLVGYLETLQMRLESDEPSMRITQEMSLQCDRISSLLKDLLTLAKLESMDGRSTQEPIQIGPLLHQVVEDAPQLAEYRDHEISMHVEDDLWVNSSRTDLLSAFSNLLYNAVRHTPPGTAIKVKAKRRGNRVEVEFVDSGPGIARQHLHRLTERFYRVESSRNSETGGTGLGLAITKHALLRSQGELEIESVLGSGSTFRCVFKAATEHNDELASAAAG